MSKDTFSKLPAEWCVYNDGSPEFTNFVIGYFNLFMPAANGAEYKPLPGKYHGVQKGKVAAGINSWGRVLSVDSFTVLITGVDCGDKNPTPMDRVQAVKNALGLLQKAYSNMPRYGHQFGAFFGKSEPSIQILTAEEILELFRPDTSREDNSQLHESKMVELFTEYKDSFKLASNLPFWPRLRSLLIADLKKR